MTEDSIELKGGEPLSGEIELRGAKNSLPKNLVASLLTAEPCFLRNVAEVEDVEIVSAMIRLFGGEIKKDARKGDLKITNKKLSLARAGKLQAVAGKSRIPILFAGPLLARLGEAFVPALGGCQIGKRPVDFHVEALRSLGAEVVETEAGFHFKAKKLVGGKIDLIFPSVGATEQVLLSAVMAEGVTELSGAAVEPEIMDLVVLLQKMGAIISVDTDRSITITGVSELHGFDHVAMPDRIEAASWACAAAVTGGEIFVRNARQPDMITFLNKFRQVGGEFSVRDGGILFRRGNVLHAIALETDVHPGFMTDWQSPFVVLLTQADGASIIHETVYENRFGYIDTLNQMGAKIQLFRECLGGNRTCRFGQRNYLHSAAIMGPTPLSGREISVPDLRAGFSYVIAALGASGVSKINNLKTIHRGYEKFTEKLKLLGAQII